MNEMEISLMIQQILKGVTDREVSVVGGGKLRDGAYVTCIKIDNKRFTIKVENDEVLDAAYLFNNGIKRE